MSIVGYYTSCIFLPYHFFLLLVHDMAFMTLSLIYFDNVRELSDFLFYY